MRIETPLLDNWKFCWLDAPVQTPPETAMFTDVSLPHVSNLNEPARESCALYQRNIQIAKAEKKRYFLRFEAVGGVARVFLNGLFLGQHRGGYSRFCLDATDAVRSGENLLAVLSDNTRYPDVNPLMGDFTYWGGIYRPLVLLETEETCFDPTYFGTCGLEVDAAADGTVHLNAHVLGEADAQVRYCITDSKHQFVDLTENDLVFITNGGCVENATMGSQNTVAPFNPEIKPGGGWDMWRRIAAQDPSFGHPDKFCHDPEQSNWMSATVTTLDQKIIPYIKNICKRDPFTGGVVTGGIVTVKDSGWLLSWTINRQPQFRNQPKDQCLVWVYGLFSDKPGDFVKKPMRECTGKEICMEWLYHIGVPVGEIEELAEHSANTVPVMMPYITAFFMPRAAGDRPDVVPEGAVNFAFLGQFAETKRDTIFTTEYSMRTGMEAVYTLLDIDRGVPEVWGSVYDIRDLLNATIQLRDGKPLSEMNLGFKEKMVVKKLLKKIRGTDIEKLLKEYHVIE